MRDVVVHVGPSRSARGGVARVITLLGASQLRDTFRLRFVSTVGAGGGVLSHLVFPVAVVHLVLLLCTAQPALVHLHTASRGSFLRKSLLARLVVAASGRYAIHLHGGGFADYYSGLDERRRAMVRRYFAAASVVFVVSRAMSEFVSETFGVVEPVVVPNPIVFPESSTRGIDGGRVISMGHLGAMKGTDVLIRAFALASVAHPGLSMVLLGDGLTGDLESLMAELGLTDKVTVVEWSPPAVVAEQLSESAIFALPSLAEGMPLSLLEAMASGLACIATPVGGVPEVLEDGITGLIVPQGDVRALASALEMLASDAELRVSLGCAARERARNHAVDTVAGVIIKAYLQLGVEKMSGGSR